MKLIEEELYEENEESEHKIYLIEFLLGLMGGMISLFLKFPSEIIYSVNELSINFIKGISIFAYVYALIVIGFNWLEHIMLLKIDDYYANQGGEKSDTT